MTDYLKDTGSSGQMRIRDTGSVVEFWITSNSSATYAYDMPWAYIVNGVTSSWRQYSYSGSNGWEKLGSWTVNDSQTVTFKLGDTGTSGLGGPTTFSVAIDRAEAPAKGTITLVSYDQDSAVVNANAGSNNGSTVVQWQIGYGTLSTATQYYKDADLSNGYATITGLAHGTKYYFWSRQRNAKGWSDWSSSVSCTTWNIPQNPDTPVLSSITATSVYVNGNDNGNNGSAVVERQIGYGTSSSSPTLYKTADAYGNATVTGLSNGTTYYFWYRVRNAVGWSGWSGRSSAKTWGVPAAPSSVSISSVTQTSVYGTFTANANNGSAITKYEIGYGTSSSAPQSTISSDGSTTITGLLPGTKHYFWARAYNSVGWSPWSVVSSATLLAGAYVNVNNVWKAAVPYVNVNGVWQVATPMVKIAGVWKGTG